MQCLLRFTAFFTAFCGLASLVPLSFGQSPQDATPLELFEQRIMPIFRSPTPSSCVQCHLSSVDLRDYIRPSHEATFLSLRDQGLIDLKVPDQSKILNLISMGDRDSDEGVRLIHEETRRAEYEAFRAWIHACCSDSRIRDLPAQPDSELARPAVPDEVIRHTRKDRLVDSFVRNIWSQRMRCFPCHTPHEIDESDPKQRVVVTRHRKFLEEFGDRFGDRLTIFHETPEATMRYLIERSLNTPDGELPLLNLDDPASSLLVQKPTSRLPAKNDAGEFEEPSRAMPVSHMGGLKMHEDDQSWKSFIAWIQDYARVARNEYKSLEELPDDNWYPSRHAVVVRQLPESWPDGSRVQIFVHAWNDQSQDWNEEPAAFTQAMMTPARTLAGMLFVLGPAGRARSDTDHTPDPQNATLPAGRYQLRAYLDQQQILQQDPTAMLAGDDFVGAAVIDAKWGEGFPQAEKLLGNSFE